MKQHTILNTVLCCFFWLAAQHVYSANITLHSQGPDLLTATWYGENRSKLEKMIVAYGNTNPSYDPTHKPVAAFDHDQTLVKNDIGDATLFWMVAHEKLKAPKDWAKLNPWLTPQAVDYLNKSCAPLSEFLPTRTQPQCADAILSIYNEETLADGSAPWLASPHPERIFPPLAFYAQLFSGYTDSEIKDFTLKALEFNLKNRVGSKQKIGSKEYAGYLRVYEPMHELVQVLKKHGFDVWIISATLQPTVEVMAEKFNIGPDRVIGVRMTKDGKGRLQDSFEACGPYPHGNKEIWSYRLGKRCWLNKIVFKEQDKEKMINNPSPLVFAAGDSDTDTFFVRDAQALRLVLNRNKPELMCFAYANTDGKWLINPMFIDPKPQKTAGYSCLAQNLPNQKDTVF